MSSSSSSSSSSTSTTLHYKGAANFRQRILLATLSTRSVKIEDIRSMDEEPGLRDYEASFLRLIDKLTNGSTIRINETGTSVKYKPGMIVGGAIETPLVHECPPSRSIGYFLEGILWLAPFSKNPFQIRFKGVTNDNLHNSVDILRTSTLPMLRRFGIGKMDGMDLDKGSIGLSLKIIKRGAPPLGGGEIFFTCPIVKELSPCDLIDEGKIKRIRGIAYATRCNPQLANRLGEAVRGVVNKYLADVYIYTDVYKGIDSGLSPGFGLAMVAETTTQNLITAEQCTEGHSVQPEELGRSVGYILLNEIQKGGCIDSVHQWLCIGFMMLTPPDVSRIRIGSLTPHTIAVLRLLKDFFNCTFNIKPASEFKGIVKKRESQIIKDYTFGKTGDDDDDDDDDDDEDNGKWKKNADMVDDDDEEDYDDEDDHKEEDGKKSKKKKKGSKKKNKYGNTTPLPTEQEKAEAKAKKAADVNKEEEDEMMEVDSNDTSIIMSCVGVGFKNMARGAC